MRRSDIRTVVIDGKLSMNQQYNVGARKAKVLGSVVCLQNEDVDSPAQFQANECSI